MTREEAIDCLEGLKIYLKTEHIDQEAIDMAIEALQAEGAQGVGRYEKAMQKLREMPKCLYGVKVKQIQKISAEPVKHGKWQVDEAVQRGKRGMNMSEKKAESEDE